MKNLIAILFLGLVFCVTSAAQDAPKVCISQEAANKCADVAAELIEARDVIAKFTAERGTGDARIAAAEMLIKRLNDVIALDDTIFGMHRKAMEAAQSVMDFQAKLIADLEKRLLKPKSSWEKIVGILKQAANILLGVAIGRVIQ